MINSADTSSRFACAAARIIQRQRGSCWLQFPSAATESDGEKLIALGTSSVRNVLRLFSVAQFQTLTLFRSGCDWIDRNRSNLSFLQYIDGNVSLLPL